MLWEHLDRVVAPGSRESDRRHFSRGRRKSRNCTLAPSSTAFSSGQRTDCVSLSYGNDVVPWNPFLPDRSSLLPDERLPAPGRRARACPALCASTSFEIRLESQTMSEPVGSRDGTLSRVSTCTEQTASLSSGDWLVPGFKPEEHFKLARISIDIDQTMDAAWDIDVRKSRARPPSGLKDDLVRISRATRKRASEVYRHRGQRLSKLALTTKQVAVWLAPASRTTSSCTRSIDRIH